MSDTMTEVSCPKCGGRMWDNRVGKKNPKAPDYKCRTRTCDGVIWPPKNGRPAAPAPTQAPNIGAPGWLDEQDGHEAQAVAAIQQGQAPAKLQSLFALYDVCLDHAALVASGSKLPQECVPAMAATLFIAAKDRGLAA